MATYGQFRPVARAMELLDGRRTLLVVRELLAGSRHFDDPRRGVPRMSSALLTERLRTLTQAGLVERTEHTNRVVHELTPAGEELRGIVEALGPGHPITARLAASLDALTRAWIGELTWEQAVRAGTLRASGPQEIRRQLPRWLRRSTSAHGPRPATV